MTIQVLRKVSSNIDESNCQELFDSSSDYQKQDGGIPERIRGEMRPYRGYPRYGFMLKEIER